MLTKPLLAAVFSIGLSTTALATDWQTLAAPDDLERIEHRATSRNDLIAIATKDGSPENLALVKDLIETASQPVQPKTVVGKWKCRSLRVGGLPPVTVYEAFDCSITSNKTGLVVRKTSGSTRFSGQLYADQGDTWVFLGATHNDNERPVPYNSSPATNMIGVFRMLSKQRLVLELPSKTHHYDLIEFYRGKAAPASMRTGKQLADHFGDTMSCMKGGGTPDERIAACERLLKDPREFRMYVFHRHHIGQALIAKGKIEEAMAQFDRVLKDCSDCKEVYIDRGLALWVLAGDRKDDRALTERALAELTKATDALPNSARAHHIRALVLIDAERWKEALKDLDRAIFLAPENRKAHLDRAEVRRKLGDEAGSEKDVATAVGLDRSTSAGATTTAKPRTALTGYRGVNFGVSPAQAKSVLGPTAKSNPVDKKPELLYVYGDISHENEQYRLNYLFKNNKMVRVELFPRSGRTNSKSKCLAASIKMINMIKREYGEPDSATTKDERTLTVFAFKDGTAITVDTTFWELSSFCITLTNYYVPEGKPE